MATEKLTVTPPPHLRSGETISHGMRDVLIALSPAVLVALVVYGMPAIYIMAISMLVAGATEAAMGFLLRRQVTLKDMSAMVTGLLFAFLLPPTTPWWVVAIGAFVAIFLGKYVVGRWMGGKEGGITSMGLGLNIFNPALFARVFLMFTPLQLYISKFVRPFYWKESGFFTPIQTVISDGTVGRVVYKTLAGNPVDVVSAATPMSLLKSGKWGFDAVLGPTPVGATWVNGGGRPSFWSMFLGLKSGCIGEISVLALLIGGLYLIWRGTINWRIPVGILGSFFLLSLITGNQPIYQLLGAGLFLGAFFMATDWVTSPMTDRGAWIYAVGIGVFIAIIRFVGARPEGVAIAILHWNAFTLLIDRYVARPRFGEVKAPLVKKLPAFSGEEVPAAGKT